MATETRIRMSATASILREQGLTWREIGERMGVSISYAHHLVSDPDNSIRNARRRKPLRTECAVCGGVLTHATGKGARKTFCDACVAERHRTRERGRWEARRGIKNAQRRTPKGRASARKSASKWYASNRAAVAARRQAAYQANIERHREEARLRYWNKLPQAKARHHASRGVPTSVDVIAMLLRDPCAYCGGASGYGVDHIVPVATGGGGEPENLTAACLKCNMKKSDTPLLLFLAKRED